MFSTTNMIGHDIITSMKIVYVRQKNLIIIKKMLREKLVWERIKEPFIKIIDFSIITPIDISFF